MKASREHKITVILELNEKEARWLMALTQNPMMPVNDGTIDESEENLEMRKNFFDTIKEQLG